MTDVRCPSKKFGELDDGLLVIKCSSHFCGAGPGVVVLHRFDSLTGELVDTQRFRDPAGPQPLKEGRTHAIDHNPAAVRSA